MQGTKLRFYQGILLTCILKRCHSSLCFDHILHLGVHSAEAILVSQSDSSDGRWHDRHKDKLLFTQARPQVVQAEKDGGRCDVRHKMVITANNFNTCMPTNPTFTKPGWYDKFVQSSNVSFSLGHPSLDLLSDRHVRSQPKIAKSML